jgi:hypothetical protein
MNQYYRLACERRVMRPGRVWLVCALVLTTPLWAAPTATQEPGQEAVEELRVELARLEALLEQLNDDSRQEIDLLRQRVAELEEALSDAEERREDDELAQLIAEADDATAEEKDKEAEAEKQRETMVGRQRNLQALNPEISVLGDFSYDWSDSSEIRDQFVLRGAEIGFQAPLDPSTRFKAFLAGHQEPPEYEVETEEPGEEEEHGHGHGDEISVTIEEIYMEWVALPANSRLRVGKFRQQFGTLNRWHPHGLPSVDVPFALRNIFGHDGLIGLGVGMDFQLPRLWASSNGLTFEIANADNAAAFAGSEFRDPTFLLRLTSFYDLGPDTYFDFGLNGVTGPNDETGDRNTTVASIDFNFLWEPANRARYRGVEIRGELLAADFETEADDSFRSTSLYTYVTAKLARQWSVGFRYDDAELPSPRIELIEGGPIREGLRERAFTPYVTFWQSEFVRLRFQYQYASRDFVWAHGPENDNRLWVQATFAAGPHKHESY